jgi:N-acetyl-anhydromuramyl-L-alanine amidase AmpD
MALAALPTAPELRALTFDTTFYDPFSKKCSTKKGGSTSDNISLSTSVGEAKIQKITPAPFTGAPIQPTGVVLHWTGGNPNQSVESFIGGMKSRDLSVQLYIDGKGNAYQLVDKLDTKTAHAGNANSKTIGIEIAAGSDGTVATSDREINANTIQTQAVVRTVMYLIQTFNMQIEPDVNGYKGILSHHLVDPGRKSDAGKTYHATILSAVKGGGNLTGTTNNTCNTASPGFTGNGADPDGNKALGQKMAAEAGFTGAEWECLLQTWVEESGWAVNAINDAEGNNDKPGPPNGKRNRRLDPENGETISDTEKDAYGIPQSLPGGKMKTEGDDWRTNPVTQIKWGLKYIKDRYRVPCGALAHRKSDGWY